jgi:hypothetical protein
MGFQSGPHRTDDLGRQLARTDPVAMFTPVLHIAGLYSINVDIHWYPLRQSILRELLLALLSGLTSLRSIIHVLLSLKRSSVLHYVKLSLLGVE